MLIVLIILPGGMLNMQPLDERLTAVGIPPRYFDASLDEFDSTHPGLREPVRDFMSRPGAVNLYLYGANGVGKTYLGCALLLEFIRRKIPVYRSNVFDFEQEFKNAGWRIPEHYYDVGVLFLDEVGKDMSAVGGKIDVALTIVESIIRWRSDYLKPTIIASNNNIGELQARYGDSFVSIVMGSYRTVMFPVGDLRLT